MYLRKIISSGFKSFADKVTITLEKNHITGIVGPNGSGKSNVIDSVRWVMGEQNAKMLRGEKATDIIFAGSEKRKPLGMAEVTLVFDNSEGSTICPPEYRSEEEIALTRRLYADGQREYFINKKPCRLKDIVGFFTSTGLGGRSYSMIQQGQVDRILQAKPEQLREIIEEAAGTLVFKKRKQQAEKKLENTRLNLSRIDDILAELGRQKKALNDQVEKAKKWKETNDELVSTEKSLLVHNFRFFSEKEKELKDDILKLSEAEVEVAASIDEFEAKLEGLQNDLAASDPEVQALSEEITVLREKIASSEASLSSAMDLIENGDKRSVDIRSELEEEQALLSEFSEKYEQAKLKLEQAEIEAGSAKEIIETFDERVEEFSERTRIFESKLAELTKELRHLDRLEDQNALRQEAQKEKNDEISSELEGMSERIAEFDNELSKAMMVVEGASVKVSNRKRELSELQSQKDELTHRMSERSSSVSEVVSERDSSKQNLMNFRAKLEALQDIEADAEKGRSSSKRLVELSQGHAHLLDQVFSLTEESESLPKGVISALENWTDRVYVTDSELTRELLFKCTDEKLSGVNLSHPTEYSLTRIDDWAKANKAIKVENYLGLNKEVLESIADEQKNELEKLLERVVYIKEVCPQNLDDIPAGLILFTKNGTLLTGGGQIQIPSLGAKGALTRQKEIEKLSSSIEKTEKNLLKLEDKLQKLKEEQLSDQNQSKTLDADILEKNTELMRVMSEFENTKNAAEQKREESISHRENLQNKENALSAGQKELTRLEEEKISLVSQKEKAQLERETIMTDNENVMAESDELKRQYDAAKLDLTAAETKAEGLREGFEEQSQRYEQLEGRVAKKKASLDRFTEELAEAYQRKDTLEKDIESFIIRRETLEETLLTKRESNSEVLEQIKVFENKIRALRSEIQTSQKKVNQKNVELERVTIALQSSIDQASERYQLNPEESDLEIPEDFNADKSSKTVTRLRTKIEAMGPINMMAIEEYERLDERESFISRQREEVNSSADLLELAIEEIEENSEEKYLKAFHILNKEFSDLFPILFPGGDASIVLTDEKNPLEGGVEIMVRLPGKKRQNMRLFSGGEKALTAIALIFGLLKSKPTPFCFLDEVDAPLDETNVGRYNKVLETLSERFQFIVITHNRRTMEVLNTLYGVTMQEPGVSKVVGVDLEKALPAHLQKAFKDKKSGATAS